MVRRAVLASLAAVWSCNLITGADDLSVRDAACPGCLPDSGGTGPGVDGQAIDGASTLEGGADGAVPGGFQDKPFGGSPDGFGTTNLLASAEGLAVKSNGKFVVVGTVGTSAAVVQFNADGTVDTNFGTDGLLLVSYGSELRGTAVAIDSQDRIVVGGDFTNVEDDGTGMGGTIAAYYGLFARLTPDGSPDPQFNGGGYRVGTYRTTSASLRDGIAAIAVGAGDVLHAGGTRDQGFGIWQIRADGDFAAFGTTGFQALPVPGITVAVAASGTSTFAAGSQSGDFLVAKLSDTGAVDGAFGTVVAGVGTNEDIATSMALQGDGKVVVAGRVAVSSPIDRSPQFGVVRLTTAGALDAAFGTGGKTIANFDEQIAFQNASDVPASVIVDGLGRIVVVGTAREKPPQAGERYRAVALRLLPDGSLDPFFGAGGKMTFVDAAQSFQVQRAAAQPDGKIVVVATTGSSLLVARILP